jgi:competence protein ComEA
MNDKIKAFLSLSNTEQRGIIGLVLIILFLFTGRILFERHAANRLSALQYDVSVDMDTTEVSTSNIPEQAAEHFEISIDLFPFDPNTSSKEDFVRLGLSEQVAGIIINYREKGGRFYQPNDLQKIYGLKTDDYERLKPYIKIPSSSYSKATSQPITMQGSNYTPSNLEVYPKKDIRVLVNINTADSSQLTAVKGIGPVYASRIIKYRDLLGGFINKEQLLEVYGITPEIYEHIDSQTTCEPTVKPIKVHEAEWVDLKSHPYISKDLANLIVNYIQNHGKMDSLGVLLNLDIIDKEDYQKLKPYLSFDQ